MGLHTDTIFALSSGHGRAGVAVVRVSGPAASAALRALGGPKLPKPRTAVLRKLSAGNGEPLDDALVVWFPEPGSFTGEDVVEFHVHGGRAVVDGLLAALGEIPRCRLAEPGEFTRWAVENGKFDLTQAEGLADLIAAETEAQRHQALRQYGGVLTRLYEGWREDLIRAAAWVEASIDFADEEIPAEALMEARSRMAAVRTEILAHVNDQRRGEILRDGFYLAVIGAPNSGKSSLVNALARRDVAIVSATAGTTRDVLEVHLDLAGYPVIVADTAGLREAADCVEAEGVRRAVARADAADAVLLLRDASRPDDALPRLSRPPDLTIWNKADLAPPPDGEIAVSVRTGEGMEALLGQIRNIVQDRLAIGGAAPPTRERHRAALFGAATALENALAALSAEIVAEELRVAMRELGRIMGRVDIEDVLDVVFQDFCIGK